MSAATHEVHRAEVDMARSCNDVAAEWYVGLAAGPGGATVVVSPSTPRHVREALMAARAILRLEPAPGADEPGDGRDA